MREWVVNIDYLVWVGKYTLPKGAVPTETQVEKEKLRLTLGGCHIYVMF